ncbi:MAG: hypothetical protein WCP34_16230 [Pseudomonadota bacterium]
MPNDVMSEFMSRCSAVIGGGKGIVRMPWDWVNTTGVPMEAFKTAAHGLGMRVFQHGDEGYVAYPPRRDFSKVICVRRYPGSV